MCRPSSRSSKKSTNRSFSDAAPPIFFLPVVPFEAAARQGDFDGRHSFRESFFPFRPLFQSLSFFARRFVRRGAKIAQRNPALVVYAKMEL